MPARARLGKGPGSQQEAVGEEGYARLSCTAGVCVCVLTREVADHAGLNVFPSVIAGQ